MKMKILYFAKILAILFFIFLNFCGCSFRQEMIFYPGSTFKEQNGHYEVARSPYHSWTTVFVIKREHDSLWTATGKPEKHTIILELDHVEEGREYFLPGAGRIIFIVKSGDEQATTTIVEGDIIVVSATKSRISLDMNLRAELFNKLYRLSGAYTFYTNR